MYNDYYDNSSSGGGTLMPLLIIMGLCYLFVKKGLPWINEKLGKDYKWWQVPLAILGVLVGLFALVSAGEMNRNKQIGDRQNRLRQLSDRELMRIIESGTNKDERISAKIIMEARIKQRKDMLRK